MPTTRLPPKVKPKSKEVEVPMETPVEPKETEE